MVHSNPSLTSDDVSDFFVTVLLRVFAGVNNSSVYTTHAGVLGKLNGILILVGVKPEPQFPCKVSDLHDAAESTIAAK